jgi:hypothetical protein
MLLPSFALGSWAFPHLLCCLSVFLLAMVTRRPIVSAIALVSNNCNLSVSIRFLFRLFTNISSFLLLLKVIIILRGPYYRYIKASRSTWYSRTHACTWMYLLSSLSANLAGDSLPRAPQEEDPCLHALSSSNSDASSLSPSLTLAFSFSSPSSSLFLCFPLVLCLSPAQTYSPIHSDVLILSDNQLSQGHRPLSLCSLSTWDLLAFFSPTKPLPTSLSTVPHGVVPVYPPVAELRFQQ